MQRCSNNCSGKGRGCWEPGDAELSSKRLRAGLALWRGPPLADLANLDCLQAEIRRLEELRLVASMERIDADLALGRGTELVAELESLLDEDPLRERLTQQLMLALYRAGRQADALSVYRRTGERLRDELGLDPSPSLQDLERSILVHDPSLVASGDGSATLEEVRDAEVCPFKGLASFGRSDADYFSGREAAVSDLVAARRRGDAGRDRRPLRHRQVLAAVRRRARRPQRRGAPRQRRLAPGADAARRSPVR